MKLSLTSVLFTLFWIVQALSQENASGSEKEEEMDRLYYEIAKLAWENKEMNATQQRQDEDIIFLREKLNETKHSVAEEFASLKAGLSTLQQMLSEFKLVGNTRVRYIPRTCQELMDSDPTLESGMYYIDPDGWNVGDTPIFVHCSKQGETSVSHDSETRIKVIKCSGAGCYSRSVNYDATMRQMKALIESSYVCSQFIRYDCKSAVMALGRTQFSWWNDRTGEKRYYWDGSGSSLNKCWCGIKGGTCVNYKLPCNCDADLPDPQFDEGHITNKSHLPVTRLNFGRTDLLGSSGEHTLGPLTCRGSHSALQSKAPTSCSDMWRSGNRLSGLYQIQRQLGTIETVFCDMSKLPDEAGHQLSYGINEIKTAIVHFCVVRNSPWKEFGGTITYELTYVNFGNAMNLATGRFTAPLRGIYSFSFVFSTEENHQTWAHLNKQRNKATEDETIATAHVANKSNGAINAIVELQPGDDVFVVMGYGGVLFGNGDRHVLFSGSLLSQLPI